MKPKPRYFHGTPLFGAVLRCGTPVFIGFTVLVTGLTSEAAIFGGLSGGQSTASQGAASANPTVPASATAARDNATAILNRTNTAVGAALALQQAARTAAANATNAGQTPGHPGVTLPNVPNGLGTGGLYATGGNTSPSSWTGANAPTQTSPAADGSVQVTIKQTTQQALLNWDSFNVGNKTTVTFDQTAGNANVGQWIAFNKVNDPSGNPTQILGSIKAAGQVYIINQNGIIFGGASQVNVHNLTASSLPINDNLVASGLLNNPSNQFLFNGLGLGNIGDVTVQAGAQISCPVGADGNGGRVMLAGANVTNAGTISTPAGQTILAAGLQIGIAAHSSSDPSLRGLDVYVGAVVDPASLLTPYAGTVSNSGVISTPRADVTITGKAVQQLGVIDSTTSVSLNGRIDLLANFGAEPNGNYAADGTNGNPYLYQSTGSVTLGANSVTRILPEYASSNTVAGTELALSSQIYLQGRTIYMGKGAEILAPNAQVSFQAGSWASLSTVPYSTFINDGGQVYLDNNAVVNLAGTVDASASVLQNQLALVLNGSVLSAAPLQKNGTLRGDQITVDISKTGTYNGSNWVGTPLADVSGYVSLIQRDVGQLTTAGGTLNITAGSSVVVRQGATMDVSGGWTQFTGAAVQTTYLVTGGGQIVNIANATPDQVYKGIYNGSFTVANSKWGVTNTYSNSLVPGSSVYEAGYLQGANAGAISISAPALALDGTLLGNKIVGPYQTGSSASAGNAPNSASLTLKFQSQTMTGVGVLATYPYQPNVIFSDGVQQVDPGPFTLDANGEPAVLPSSRSATSYVSPALFSSNGFANLTVENAGGNIELLEGVALNGSPGASLSLKASNIAILGGITVSGGNLNFTAYNISPYDAALLSVNSAIPSPVAGRGVFTLGANASINTSGLVINDQQVILGEAALPVSLNGGSVSIQAYQANLSSGGVIDVSGGYEMKSSSKGTYGNAGSITVQAGQDPTVSPVLGGALSLGATLRGYSGGVGGTLSIQAPQVQIGDGPSSSNTLLLSPDFFSQGGFDSFQISGLGGGSTPAVLVTPGTLVAPVLSNFTATPSQIDGSPVLSVIQESLGVRKPVNISLSAPGVKDLSGSLLVRGDVVVGGGAILRADPGGTISISGNTVSILGSVYAPGGSITVAGGGSTSLVFNDATQALATTYLGPAALLSTAGTTVLLPDAFNRRIGSVLAGGNITITGNIAAAAGAVLDASGTSGVLDLSPYVASPVQNAPSLSTGSISGPPEGLITVPTRIDSNGGNITLKGSQILFSDATLLANAGGVTAIGGALSVSSGHYSDPQGSIPPISEVNLTVSQSGSVFGGATPAVGASLGNGGHFSISSFANGGFDSLSLNGVVSFVGAVNVTARGSLSVASSGFIYADSPVNLAASYVALGISFHAPTQAAQIASPFGTGSFAPSYGSGSLSVEASLIDVGSLSLQNIGSASLTAAGGDIRGNGTFHMAGNLTLKAGQIYPVTASSLSFIVYDSPLQAGTITIKSSGNSQLPLSAGGTLGIYASVIDQEGTLRAPFGSINIGWDGTGTAPVDILLGNSQPFPITSQLTIGAGSVTSVSAVDPVTGKGLIIPYGVSTNGQNWIDPTGTDITTGGLSGKSIVLASKSVITEPGSTIDLRGGGDLYAYQWIPGLGGLTDILSSNNSFAVIPGYQSNFAPVSTFNDSSSSSNLVASSGPGYVNPTLQVGDRIYLAGSATLAAGYYTLLPARYALLPGAVLVTPSNVSGQGTVNMPDGSSDVSGFRFNSLDTARTLPTVSTRFEVASAAVIQQRAQYVDFLANTFLKSAAQSANIAIPLLPTDSGQLVYQASQAMSLSGSVLSNSISGGRGSQIDISTPLDTYITSASASVTIPPGSIVLDAAELNAFGAESLLIGGKRTWTSGGDSVDVTSVSVTLDNPGSPLSAKDLILVASDQITIAGGAVLNSVGSLTNAEKLLLSGNGAMVRVSGDPNAAVVRSGVTTTTTPVLSIGAGASLTGNGLILDSSSLLALDPSAKLQAKAFSLSSGQITMELGNPGTLPNNNGLVVTQGFLEVLSAAQSLSLLSYSTIDLYGTGDIGGTSLAQLNLSAGGIRGFNQNGGAARILASRLLLENTADVTGGTPVSSASGTLDFQAGTVQLGANSLNISGYANTEIIATTGVIAAGSGTLATAGSLTLQTPVLTGASGAVSTISAGGILNLAGADFPSGLSLTGGLGSSLELTGTEVNISSKIYLPSGSLSILASQGDLTVSGALDVSGTGQAIQDVTRYTNAGQITLSADQGNVILNSGSLVNLSANAGGGNAGTLTISAPSGSFVTKGTIQAQGGNGGIKGDFNLDIATLSSLSSVENTIDSSGLTDSQTIRVRTGNVTVDSNTVAHNFSLSADEGSISVTGTIDASGQTGGSIYLSANGNLTTVGGSKLTVAGKVFSDAGKGGNIILEAGSETNGVVGSGVINLQTGSTLDLSVASKIAGDLSTVGSSAYQGEFSGTLHLRAPQMSGDVGVSALNANIIDASSILVEGYRLYNLKSTGGLITSTVESSVKNDATAFLGANGTASAAYTSITNRLLANNSGLSSILVLASGAEIINTTGGLTLGTVNSTTTSDWDLSGFRFGPDGAPGVLTLRASGNITLYNALSDGFTPTLSSTDTTWLWTARLTAYNSALPTNSQSWSYRITAGADFSSSYYGTTLSLGQLAGSAGSLVLGKTATNLATGSGSSATTASAIANRYQVIRTGSGNIDIYAARNVELLNQFATIYTAGTRLTDFTMGGTFSIPSGNLTGMPSPLGNAQQSYPALYSMAGGNVDIYAGEDIEHLTLSGGVLVPDSQLQMPDNWLYRRGYMDPTTGDFALNYGGESASTTWWVNFSNFFQGVGALGGGNVTMIAGNNISNVDAVIPTNARMPGYTDSSHKQLAAPDASKLLELGGGDLTARAGNNIDAGVYYVERGVGNLSAGGSIHTNATRSVLAQSNISAGQSTVYTDLPTTLFVGNGGFNVEANGNVLLGPVANPFLLPGGLLNSFWQKSYFSTYTTESFVNAVSLGGSVTLRDSATLPSQTVSDPTSLLGSWFANKLLFTAQSASYREPWLRLDETSTTPFSEMFTISPGNLTVTSFSGDINVVGNLTLSPSPTGRLELLAAGSINALQPNGVVKLNGTSTTTWGTSTINLSDANPASIPGVSTPYGFETIAGTTTQAGITGDDLFLNFINQLFYESGGTLGENIVLQVKQALHASGILHLQDAQPALIYAGSGDISGLTLFSPKETRVYAGQNLTDVALYIQNTRPADISIVASGRDIIPSDSTSQLRIDSQLPGNALNNSAGPLAGDIQISGPGTLEVLAGRNIDLGVGTSNADGTGEGITSIGNTRNPYLDFTGADIISAAGLGGIATGLSGSKLDFQSFIKSFVTSSVGTRYLAESDGILGVSGESVSGVSGSADKYFQVDKVDPGSPAAKAGIKPGDILLQISGNKIPSTYDDSYLYSVPTGIQIGQETSLTILRDGKQMTLSITPGTNQIDLTNLPAEQQDQMALSLLYLVLRDAGRDHNDPYIPNYGNYTDGLNAIKALFPGTKWDGSINTEGRNIRTTSGGNISLLAPGGGLTLATTTIGNTQAPPGIVTEDGGNISIFTNENVNLGISRIFTLRGGNEIIWSSNGGIAAGSSSKTVKTAPPTRVLIDPQSASVNTDLSGLATGGGIGVLASVVGVTPGSVDLIAPKGTVDAGEAGIRATGNLNIAANQVLNSANITVGGTSAGTPEAPSAPSVAAISGASSVSAAAGAAEMATQTNPTSDSVRQQDVDSSPSIITVEVIGYGGSDNDEDSNKAEQNESP